MTELDNVTWRSIHSEVRRRIHERVWPPGSLVPNETDLAVEFGCARATVNRAMRALADAGLIDRKRRAGTRVALLPNSRVVLDIPIIRREVEQRNAVWRHSLLYRKVSEAPLALAGKMNLDRHAKVLHLASIHFADDRPFLHEDRWINIAAVPGVTKVDFASVSANEWLVQNAPFTRGDISFSAINAGASMSELLDIKENSAIFIVDRTTWDNTTSITSVRLSYTAGYRMNSQI